MKTIVSALQAHPQVSDYKINLHEKQSYELFFVKGRLETVRCTETTDKEVTVYADHGEFKGDASFYVYPSTDVVQLKALIGEAVGKALLIDNKTYTLPEKEEGSYVVESNFASFEPGELAARIAKAVFAANDVENAALNAVEIFINRHTERVLNSKGLDKTQVRYDAMVEAIPTYNGEKQSVELYEQYNFGSFDEQELVSEIAGKLREVRARYEAVKPEEAIRCPVILNREELQSLFENIAYDLSFGAVYMQANLHKKGDAIQKDITGDAIGIVMAGEADGSISSRKFDGDGLRLTPTRIVDGGKAAAYHGGNRFAQYLDEVPTGDMNCICVDVGTVTEEEFTQGESLEVISMSGLQVDFYSDYIGGEVRLAYHRRDGVTVPVTGISISGKLSEVLGSIRLSEKPGVFDSYTGPEKAILTGMTVF